MRCCKIDCNKDYRITIRITKSDFDFLEDYANMCNCSVSDALRKIIKVFRLTENKTK